MLRTADAVLIERGERGTLKQLTVMTLAAAPPAAVREVVIHPERYGEFVRNMKRSTVRRAPDGEMIHDYSISYTIYTVEGRHQYHLDPSEPGQAAAPVDMFDPDANGRRHYRWEFLPVADGTLIVMYGYTDVPHDGFIERFLKRAPTLEVGLALIPQMTLLLAMRDRAQQLAGGRRLPPIAEASYGFLLERGTVALVRSREGRISDISLIARSAAKPDGLVRAASEPMQWSRFVATIDRSTPMAAQNGLAAVELESSLPLMTFTTTYAYRSTPTAVDLFAVAGDLHGGRIRVDARPIDAAHAELILRLNQRFDQGSLVVRQLYKLEPLFEHGVDVGLGLLYLEGLRSRGEALSVSQVQR
jgi:hypothetical protein